MRTSAAALLAFALASCTADSSDPGGSPTLILEEVLRIGSLDDEATAFGQIRDLAVSDDRLFVLEGAPPRVLRFSTDGERLGEFGGPGDGPGEFQRPGRVGVVRGRVWVSDFSGRVELFEPEGRSVESVRFQVPADARGTAGRPLAPLADGSFLAGPGSYGIVAVVEGQLDHLTYYRADGTGAVLDTLLSLRIPKEDFFVTPLGESMLMGAHPITEAPLVSVFPDATGIAVVERWIAAPGDTAFFTLRVLEPAGDLRFETRVPYLPRPLEDWFDRFVNQMSSRPSAMEPAMLAQMAEAFREGLVPRASFAPVTRLVAGRDSSLWLRREDDLRGEVDWQVFDARGTLMGSARLPTDLRLSAVSLTDAWGIVTDSLDVPYIVRMELRR